jgi:CheY-like chemotaxis protein
MKKRILFVDDQSAMLLVYELALKHMADEWQLFFAANGVEALQLMARTPIDVVVSELCLPRMDGVQFLNEVALRYPHTIRFVLSARFRPEDMEVHQRGPPIPAAAVRYGRPQGGLGPGLRTGCLRE